MLFGCYRRVDANDPDIYVAAIAAVLAIYEADLIREVTDPRTGIITSEKYMSFMPSVGELRHYCEGVAARKERLQRLGSLPVPDLNQRLLERPPPRPGDLATMFVPASSHHYQKFLEWSKTADPRHFKFEARPGIWVSYDTWEMRQTVTRPRTEVSIRRLDLSDEAKRAMASRDAERYGTTPADQRDAAE